jgi:hypothetical protein
MPPIKNRSHPTESNQQNLISLKLENSLCLPGYYYWKWDINIYESGSAYWSVIPNNYGYNSLNKQNDMQSNGSALFFKM